MLPDLGVCPSLAKGGGPGCASACFRRRVQATACLVGAGLLLAFLGALGCAGRAPGMAARARSLLVVAKSLELAANVFATHCYLLQRNSLVDPPGLSMAEGDTLLSVDYEIFGKVQGVFFRKYTQVLMNLKGFKSYEEYSATTVELNHIKKK
nr:acylphosphatase-1 isoform X2 [Chlorocebus sabaeus]